MSVFVFKMDAVVAVFRFGGCDCVGCLFSRWTRLLLFSYLAAVIVLLFVFKMDTVVAVFRFGDCDCVGVCFQDGRCCCCFQIWRL